MAEQALTKKKSGGAVVVNKMRSKGDKQQHQSTGTDTIVAFD
jgi:hypothetical protein